ncbi:MAG: hypothetical protein DELT_03029 [Desulfovibrio sp.]
MERNTGFLTAPAFFMTFTRTSSSSRPLACAARMESSFSGNSTPAAAAYSRAACSVFVTHSTCLPALLATASAKYALACGVTPKTEQGNCPPRIHFNTSWNAPLFIISGLTASFKSRFLSFNKHCYLLNFAWARATPSSTILSQASAARLNSSCASSRFSFSNFPSTCPIRFPSGLPIPIRMRGKSPEPV